MSDLFGVAGTRMLEELRLARAYALRASPRLTQQVQRDR
jgi:hypothetical protein